MAVISNGTTIIDAGALGAGVATGTMKLLQTQTASSSATIDFTSNIDSTYKSYIFRFINIHPATDNVDFSFQTDTGSNTNYNQTITSSAFRTAHSEDDSSIAAGPSYRTGDDQAQGTSFNLLGYDTGADNDQNICGELQLFDPSDTTFVKHFIAVMQNTVQDDVSQQHNSAGYVNTTTALTRVRFKFSSGNIDAGTIKLYGVS